MIEHRLGHRRIEGGVILIDRLHIFGGLGLGDHFADDSLQPGGERLGVQQGLHIQLIE